MTNVDQLVLQMEFSETQRRQFAFELLKARQVLAALQRHRSRLPHQVQTALRLEPVEQQIGPDMPGSPGLALGARA